MTTKISADNIQPATLETLASGGGTVVYQTIASLPLSNVNDGDLAFVAENNRLYIWNGAGWFNIALLNTSPTITQGPNPSYVFATNGTPIVLTLVANDPEGIPITWSYQITSGTLGNTATIVQNNNVFTITPSTSQSDVGIFQVTFIASDGVNIATAVSSFILQFAAADQFYNRSIVLTTSNVNNGNNNLFVDSSSNNFAITRNGNVSQGTFSPFSPAGWSAYFDGAGDMLTATSVPGPLTGNFTYEAWVYPTSSTLSYRTIFGIDNYGSTTPFRMYQFGTRFEFWYTGNNNIASGTIALNEWYHVAVTRSGSSLRLFINGVQVGSTITDTANYPTSNFRIGMDSAGTFPFIGNISNVRAINGTALYTTNFTPPTEPLTAVAGTTLLTLQDNRFVDRSTNNFTITRAGDVRVSPFSPFIPPAPYIPSIHSGSGFFSGTSTGLVTPSNGALSMGTGDFTFEAWVYPTSTATWQQVVGPTYDTNNIALLIQSGVNAIAYTTASTLSWSGVIGLFQWNHIALVRTAGTIWLFVNGVRSPTSAAFTGVMNLSTLFVGQRGAGGENFSGHISNVRVTRGLALYNSATYTVPTAPLTPTTGTSLLLNFTNSNIFDETGKVVLETAGDSRVNTSIIRFGDGSVSFDGTGDFLQFNSTPETTFGAGDLTIEGWFYSNSISTLQTLVERRAALAVRGIAIFIENSTLRLNAGDTSTTAWEVALTSGTLAGSTWHHFALTRSGSTWQGYLNGTQIGSNVTWTGSVVDETSPWLVGAAFGGASGLNGFISDLRITRGRARYTANFTPPIAKLGYNSPQ